MCIEMDWFPTIAELSGIDISGADIDGKSLMPVVKSNSEKSQHSVLYWQHGSYNDNLAQWVVRKGDWKLIGNAKERVREGEIVEDKLFLSNLKIDITEKENLAENFPGETGMLKALHDEWIRKVQKEMNYSNGLQSTKD
jgi:arylsulfatase A-like enzyme